MNICIIGPSFGYGGANIIAAKVGRELEKIENIIYYSYNYKDNYSDLSKKRLFFFEGTHNRIMDKLKKGLEYSIHKEFTPYKYYTGEIQRLYELIETYNIECVILNSTTAVTIFSVPLRKTYPNIKQIGWMHETADFSFNTLAKNYLSSYKSSLKTLDYIICLTKTDLEIFIKYNLNTKVIHNPVTFETDRTSSLRHKIISFTSRLDINIKGLDYLMILAKSIPNDWKIRVAANGRKDQIDAFLDLIEKSGVSEKIIYVGALKGNDLIEHYVNSSIFISTSRIESFQLVLIEAMECGLPIVSFKHNGAKEILDNGKYGILIDNYEIDQMIEQVIELCNSEEKRSLWQKRSMERVKDFDLSTIMYQWKTLLNSLGVEK